LRASDHFAVEGHAEGGVKDDAEKRAAAAQAAAIGEHWVVGEDGVDAGEGRVGLPAEGLDGGAGFLGRDPEGLVSGVLADGWRYAAIEGHGDFHEDERTLVLAPAGEALVEAAGFWLTGAQRNLNACST
jgi:hypothetical protein